MPFEFTTRRSAPVISGNLAEDALSILHLVPSGRQNIQLQFSLKEEGEIPLCNLLLLKQGNLKDGMGFFLLSNSAKGC